MAGLKENLFNPFFQPFFLKKTKKRKFLRIFFNKGSLLNLTWNKNFNKNANFNNTYCHYFTSSWREHLLKEEKEQLQEIPPFFFFFFFPTTFHNHLFLFFIFIFIFIFSSPFIHYNSINKNQIWESTAMKKVWVTLSKKKGCLLKKK